MLDRLRAAGFDVATRNHAAAILSVDFPDETAELVETLLGRIREQPVEGQLLPTRLVVRQSCGASPI